MKYVVHVAIVRDTDFADNSLHHHLVHSKDVHLRSSSNPSLPVIHTLLPFMFFQTIIFIYVLMLISSCDDKALAFSYIMIVSAGDNLGNRGIINVT